MNALLRAELREAFDEALADRADSPATEGRFGEGSAAELLTAESNELDLP